MYHKPDFVWERIDTKDGPGTLYRAKIPGGWLVALERNMIHVPDPAHAWQGDTIDNEVE
jgi:hypothetical protein